MCYSAMVEQRLRTLARGLLAEVDWGVFEELLRRRLERSIKVGRALEANFMSEASSRAHGASATRRYNGRRRGAACQLSPAHGRRDVA